MRGEATAESGVTGVSGVVVVADNVSKLLELQQQRQQRHWSSGAGEGVFSGVGEGVVGLSESDEVELKERNGMAMGSVPERYLDAWARLQCQRPAGIDEPRWIDAAGRFLDQWGSLAAGFSWKAGDLFDCPNADGAMGLTWWLRGRGVSAVGPVNAVANVPGGPAYDRTTHRDRIEPHARRGQPEYLSPLEYQMAVIRRVHGGGR